MNKGRKLYIQTDEFATLSKPFAAGYLFQRTPKATKSNIYDPPTPKHQPNSSSWKVLKLLRRSSEEDMNRPLLQHIQCPISIRRIETQTYISSKLDNSPRPGENLKTPKHLADKNGKNSFFLQKRCIPKSNKRGLKETSSTIATGKTQSPTSIPSFVRQRSPPRLRSFPFLEGQASVDSFQLIKKVGEGKYGKVYLAKEIKTGLMVGLKVVNKKTMVEGNFLGQFMRELKIQLYLNHPNIIKVYGFFHDQENFYIIMEYGCDGQLYNLIERKEPVTEEGAAYIAKNLLEATSYLHSKRIIHRDIKPQNIVLVHGNVKLCDFGWAVNHNEQLRSTFCGTPLYFSPELLSGQKYDQKVDVWAIGVLVYELLLKSSPFGIRQSSQLYKIVENEVKYPKDKQVSRPFKKFISKMLEKNPRDRVRCEELLSMSFIRKYEEFQTCQQFCK